MKYLAVVAFIAVFAFAMADNPNANDETLRFDYENKGDNAYKFAFETSGGIKHEEDGNVPNPEAEEPSISVRGSYSFVADDGQTYTVNYVADENGYRPEGAHLPKA